MSVKNQRSKLGKTATLVCFVKKWKRWSDVGIEFYYFFRRVLLGVTCVENIVDDNFSGEKILLETRYFV